MHLQGYGPCRVSAAEHRAKTVGTGFRIHSVFCISVRHQEPAHARLPAFTPWQEVERRNGVKDYTPLNNNRGNNNNNRRRGRNNNRPQGGGGQQLNRIDSRARGNAPQLLEKYRKLAQDAHMNGDRVTAEYYLQFADHYFRVIADTRLRQEEQRMRRDERWQEGGEPFREEADESDFSVDTDFPTFDQPPVYQRREREERDSGGRDGSRDHGNREQGGGGRDPGGRESGGREWRNRRDERPAREESQDREPAADGAEAAGNPYEPNENPFLRPNRARAIRAQREEGQDRGTRPDSRERSPRRARGEGSAGQPVTSELAEGEPVGLDPALLPPAIGRDAVEDAEAAPAPRRRTRRKPVVDGDETLQSLG